MKITVRYTICRCLTRVTITATSMPMISGTVKNSSIQMVLFFIARQKISSCVKISKKFPKPIYFAAPMPFQSYRDITTVLSAGKRNHTQMNQQCGKQQNHTNVFS